MSSVIEQFTKVVGTTNTGVLDDVRDYVGWVVGRRQSEFDPRETGDVDIRSYLLHLRIDGATATTLSRTKDSLKLFYDWSCKRGLLFESPFSQHKFEHMSLNTDQIRKRRQDPGGNERDRELARLRAAKYLAERLNRSTDVESVIDSTLNALVTGMGLQTAWAYLRADVSSRGIVTTDSDPHDFVLAGYCNLPPGLLQDDSYFLRWPPDCRCQCLLRSGRLTRAVNIVECSRIRDASSAGGDAEGLKYHATVPVVTDGSPAGTINVATETWELLSADDLSLLSSAAEQVACAISRARLHEEVRAHREGLHKELSLAHVVQTGFMPDKLPDIPGYNLAAEWCSAQEVAGDFYDVFALADGRWGFVIADVSGKGAGAALYMAVTHTLIQAVAKHNARPDVALAEVNRSLAARPLDEMFVSMFYGVLDPGTGELTYTNAGHDWPFLRRASGEIERLRSNAPVLGIISPTHIEAETIRLEPDDSIVMFTDGVTEAHNCRCEQYGAKKLEAAIRAAPPKSSSQAILEHLMTDLVTFTMDAPQSDDITALIISRD